MTGNDKRPAERQPTQEPQPGQQDQGGPDRGLSGADIGDDPGEDPRDNEVGGG